MPHWNKILIHDSIDDKGTVRDSEEIIEYHRGWKNIKSGDQLTEEQAKHLIALGVPGVSRPWKEGGDHWHIVSDTDDATKVTIKMVRPMTANGAHVREGSLNKNAISIRVIGDFTESTGGPLDPWQLDRLLVLIKFLMKTYKIPVEGVLAHHEVSKCDCFSSLDMGALRDMIRDASHQS